MKCVLWEIFCSCTVGFGDLSKNLTAGGLHQNVSFKCIQCDHVPYLKIAAIWLLNWISHASGMSATACQQGGRQLCKIHFEKFKMADMSSSILELLQTAGQNLWLWEVTLKFLFWCIQSLNWSLLFLIPFSIKI